MLKIDTKCLCKKSIYRFKKGNSYYITWYCTTEVILRSVVDEIEFDEIFHFKEHTDFNSDVYFYDHFYTESEERKLKLENINNVR